MACHGQYGTSHRHNKNTASLKKARRHQHDRDVQNRDVNVDMWTCVSTTKIAHATIAIERILIVAGVKKGALIFIDPPRCARLKENDVINSVRRRCVEGTAQGSGAFPSRQTTLIR